MPTITKAQLQKIIKEELTRVNEMSQQKKEDAAKKAAMGLLDAAKDMKQAPSHVSASEFGSYVAKQANIIMDLLVAMESSRGAGSAEAPGGAGPGGGERTPWGGEQAFKRDY